MAHRIYALAAIAASGLALASTQASADTVYDFGSVPQGTTVTPYTLDGAAFDSPQGPGAFTFGANGGLYSTLGPNVLSSAGNAATLTITFATAQTGLSFDAAMGDFLQLNGTDTITVTTNAGVNQTLVPVIPAGSGDDYPQVLFSLASAAPFTFVTISAADAAGPESLAIADMTSTPVPLPASIWLFASALAGLGLRRVARKAA